MKRMLLVCIGILTLTLTAGAQIPTNQKKAPQRAQTYAIRRDMGSFRHTAPQHTFSDARFRRSGFSAALSDPMRGSTRLQPRINRPFGNQPAMTDSGRLRRFQSTVTKSPIGPGFAPSLRPATSYVNRSPVRDDLIRRENDAPENSRRA